MEVLLFLSWWAPKKRFDNFLVIKLLQKEGSIFQSAERNKKERPNS